ncbi:MAG: ATP phosphoribosyltransferase regulatory subunit [Spirochaetales bacterium]
MNSASHLYKLPQGTERLMLEDAFRRQELVRRVQNLFTRWGYQPVQTPVFDFYDLYAPLLGRQAESVYRLVDREGDLLMLRSDITLFLARSLGVALQSGHAPLRVCYSDTILRHQDLEDIAANEFFQIGAEFLGASGPEGDLEMLLLLEEVLTTLGLPQARIHLGSRGVFDAAFGALDAGAQAAALEAVLLRRWDELPGPQALRDLFGFIGTATEARAQVGRLQGLSPATRAQAELVIELASRLEALGFGERFRVDFSEAGRQSYYTGLVFRVYQPGLGDALAAGGRYDKLLARFGLDSPSVGFSFHLGKVETLVDLGKLDSPATAPGATGATLEQRFHKAREARQAGRNMTL